ncbi:MAG: chorismate mutase [Gemmataceae bacterium]
MSRKPDAPSPEKEAASGQKALRVQIDKLDVEIVGLLNKRASIAGQIGKVKAEHGGVEVFNAAREEEVLANVLKASKGPLEEVTIKAVFRELISGSRAAAEGAEDRVPRAGCSYGRRGATNGSARR